MCGRPGGQTEVAAHTEPPMVRERVEQGWQLELGLLPSQGPGTRVGMHSHGAWLGSQTETWAAYLGAAASTAVCTPREGSGAIGDVLVGSGGMCPSQICAATVWHEAAVWLNPHWAGAVFMAQQTGPGATRRSWVVRLIAAAVTTETPVPAAPLWSNTVLPAA